MRTVRGNAADRALVSADKITLDRIKLLHPAIRDKVRKAYLDINYRLLGKGVRLRFAYTLRTIEEQDRLYSLGRTVIWNGSGKKQGIVTNARGGQSIHNYGLAFDIVLLLDRDKNGTFESASWNVHADFDGDMKPDWMECIDGFKAIGAEWGGDWRWSDKPHLQFTFGLNWQKMKVKLNSNDCTIEMIDGKEYKWINVE